MKSDETRVKVILTPSFYDPWSCASWICSGGIDNKKRLGGIRIFAWKFIKNGRNYERTDHGFYGGCDRWTNVLFENFGHNKRQSISRYDLVV